MNKSIIFKVLITVFLSFITSCSDDEAMPSDSAQYFGTNPPRVANTIFNYVEPNKKLTLDNDLTVGRIQFVTASGYVKFKILENAFSRNRNDLFEITNTGELEFILEPKNSMDTAPEEILEDTYRLKVRVLDPSNRSYTLIRIVVNVIP